MPKYIRPYRVTKSHPAESRYTLDLPPELQACRIHPTFHVSRLRTYTKNDNSTFPKREVCAYYNFGDAEDNEWLVGDILTHYWEENKVSFLLQWNLRDTTWEPYSTCKELTALDQYLELLGIDNWKALPRKSSAVQVTDATDNHPSHQRGKKLMSKSSSTEVVTRTARRSSRIRT